MVAESQIGGFRQLDQSLTALKRSLPSFGFIEIDRTGEYWQRYCDHSRSEVIHSKSLSLLMQCITKNVSGVISNLVEGISLTFSMFWGILLEG